MDRTKTIKHGEDIYMFDEEAHVHSLNGKKLYGVTTIIDSTLAKPALIPWAVKMTSEWIKDNCGFDGISYRVTNAELDEAKRAHSKKKTDAGDWGTRVHNACEIWARTGIKPEGQDIMPSVQNFIDFIQNNGFKVLDVEKNVWSKSLWVGGIFDLILEKDGKVYIADIKTSSGIYDSHFIQMGAYYDFLTELDWVKLYTKKKDFDGAIVINLKKDNTIQHCTSEALPTMVETFRSAVRIHKNKAVLEIIMESTKRGLIF